MPASPVSLRSLALLLLAPLLVAFPGGALARTFLLAPGDVVAAIDAFNGEVIARSGGLGRAVSVRRGAVRLSGSVCPSVAADPQRAITRVRFLDSAARAAALARTRSAQPALGNLLAELGGGGWVSPATAVARQPHWVVVPPSPGIMELSTVGFPAGDPLGGLDATAADDARAAFRADLGVSPDPTTGPAGLVLALTVETRPTRPGRAGKRSECFLVAPALPADVEALVDLLAATPLTDATRTRLGYMLAEAEHWVAVSQPVRAARSARAFALEVARRSVGEVGAADAEALIARALAMVEALGL